MVYCGSFGEQTLGALFFLTPILLLVDDGTLPSFPYAYRYWLPKAILLILCSSCSLASPSGLSLLPKF